MRLSNFLRETAVAVGVISAFNMALFAYTSLVVFNPFTSLLLFLFSPFCYLMGIAAERNEKR